MTTKELCTSNYRRTNFEGKFDEEWEGRDGNTVLDGQPALTKGCKLGCKATGMKDVISILSSGQGTSSQEIFDRAAIKELKSCKIYGEAFFGLDGQPRIIWHIMKNGKGVNNPSLYKYLNKAGNYLDPSMIEFVSQEVWNDMVKDGFRRGVIISSEKEYNRLIRSVLSSAQYVEDGIDWLNDSGMEDVLTMLGFAYSAYKMNTKTVADKRASMSNDVISGSKNGKKYTIDKSKSTGNVTYKKASGAVDDIPAAFKQTNFCSTYEARLGQTPAQGNKKVQFVGARGESLSTLKPPPDAKLESILKDAGVDVYTIKMEFLIFHHFQKQKLKLIICLVERVQWVVKLEI